MTKSSLQGYISISLFTNLSCFWIKTKIKVLCSVIISKSFVKFTSLHSVVCDRSSCSVSAGWVQVPLALLCYLTLHLPKHHTVKHYVASCPTPWHPAVHCPFFSVNLAPGRQGGVVLEAKIPLHSSKGKVWSRFCGPPEACLRPALTSPKCDLCRLQAGSRMAFTSRCDPQRLSPLSKRSSAHSEHTDKDLSKSVWKEHVRSCEYTPTREDEGRAESNSIQEWKQAATHH